MSICKGIGNGISGVIGKTGAGLGSALGLGSVVDIGTRAYTGYGLIETLSVPYIECPDGSFATAIEWYGSGLKCPKRPPQPQPSVSSSSSSSSSGNDAGEAYNKEIEALGGRVYPYVAFHLVEANNARGYNTAGGWRGEASDRQADKYGNTVKEPPFLSGRGDSQVYAPAQEGFGGWESRLYSGGISYTGMRNDPDSKARWSSYRKAGAISVGMRISLPEKDLPFAPSAAPRASAPAFSPRPPSPPEKCQMTCPCISLQDIKKAVKEVLGIAPFSPEKLIREMGAQMFVAPGPSVTPIVPTNLVQAIAGLVAANYMRAGYGRYPVVMPGSLIAGDNPAGDAVPTKAIENFAEWFEWHILQQDAVQGEWPIEIKIKDGLKEEPMKFENISEALAEMSGLIIQVAADADTAVNAACTAAGIAQKAVNAATIGQKNIECLIQCFGFRTGFKALFVQSSITPADPDDKSFNVRKFLSPSAQNLAILTDNDDFDFQAMLDIILRNTEISRASAARSVDKDGLPGDFARNQRKYDAGEALQDTKKSMETLEASLKAKNPEIKIKIKVDGTPSDSTIQGNNFVIKRPKP